jgi:SAM-dependent methyltransferase
LSFADVDRAADPARCIEYLDNAARSMLDAKARLRELAGLDGCARWLDVGCGVGHDVGDDTHAVGVDRSTKLLEEGRTRWPAARLLAADGHALPFAEGAFDGCRVERVLQHVADPVGVIGEIRRVLRPGARVAVFEPDWASITFNARDEVFTRAFADRTAERNRQGRIGRHVARLLSEAGFSAVDDEAETVSWRSLHGIRHLYGFDAVLATFEADAVDARRSREWLADLKRLDEAGTFWAFLTRHYVSAVA